MAHAPPGALRSPPRLVYASTPARFHVIRGTGGAPCPSLCRISDQSRADILCSWPAPAIVIYIGRKPPGQTVVSISDYKQPLSVCSSRRDDLSLNQTSLYSVLKLKRTTPERLHCRAIKRALNRFPSRQRFAAYFQLMTGRSCPAH